MGGILGDTPKAPEIKNPAPAIDEPIKEAKAPEMGAQESPSAKKNKGKKALKIDLSSSRGSSGVGLNTPR